MKTTGMQHQIVALERMQGKRAYGLLMEQGTGKTWAILADAERCFVAGKIDTLCVVAPRGVHTNWVKREIPKHLAVRHVAYAWDGRTSKRAERLREVIFEEQPKPTLRILTINFEALISKRGFAFAERFVRSGRCLLVIDESSRIKSPPKRAARTDACLRLGKLAEARRIATGTPITNAPADCFYQFEFLRPGLLGTTSYRAFVAEYTRLLPDGHPLKQNIVSKNPRAAWAQIPERDAITGRPIYKNLDKLSKLIEQHSYRVLKRDCLDLPPKVYKTIYFDMTQKQEAAYKLMEKKFRMELEDGSIDTVAKLNAIGKLQQITSGFLIDNARRPFYVEKEGLPRLDAYMELIEDIDGQVITWASFKEEIVHVGAALREAGRRVVEYHGDTPVADRERAVDDFQAGKADVFLGHPEAGGIGLTLTAANTAIYYSNSFKMETRAQSEDRCHRIGTKGDKVTYIDILATYTIDEIVYDALFDKRNLAATILNDFSCLDRNRGAF
jgi:SNF2 family DNA or RNA helicase